MWVYLIFFPKRCVGCGRIGRYICGSCRKLIIPIAPNECICPVCEKPAIGGMTHLKCRTRYSLDGLTGFFYYNTVLRETIKAIKYRFVRDLGREITGIIPLSAYEIRSFAGNPETVLILVPLHTSRLRYRGFNQAEMLGSLVAGRLNITIRSDILIRSKITTSQVEKSNRQERLQNMLNVFSLSPSGSVSRWKNILLFDDVFTTGATMRSAAGVLKHHGVQCVWGVTIAR